MTSHFKLKIENIFFIFCFTKLDLMTSKSANVPKSSVFLGVLTRQKMVMVGETPCSLVDIVQLYCVVHKDRVPTAHNIFGRQVW